MKCSGDRLPAVGLQSIIEETYPREGAAVMSNRRTAGEAGWHASRYNLFATVPGSDNVAIVNLFKGNCAEYTPIEVFLLSMVEELSEHLVLTMHEGQIHVAPKSFSVAQPMHYSMPRHGTASHGHRLRLAIRRRSDSSGPHGQPQNHHRGRPSWRTKRGRPLRWLTFAEG